MKVARQFIAWDLCKKSSRPGGYGVTRAPGLFVALGEATPIDQRNHTVPPGRIHFRAFPGNKLPGYLHCVPTGHSAEFLPSQPHLFLLEHRLQTPENHGERFPIVFDARLRLLAASNAFYEM